MDLRIEQVIARIRTMPGHMQRNDITKKSIKASLIGHQIMAGPSLPYYMKKRSKLPYMPDNTQWSYMWSMVQEYDLEVKIHNEWLPSMKYKNDRNIMEVAIEDNQLKNNPWKLEIINNCRVFLQVFTLGETLMEEKNEIDPKFLNGASTRQYEEVTLKKVDHPQ